MKTRYKIITISVISISGFLIVPFYATNIYCDIFEPTNGGCIRIAGFGIIDYTNLPYFVIDSRNTGNPNECWYDDGDGNIIPCTIETGPILWPSLSPTDSNCDEECSDNETSHTNDFMFSWNSIFVFVPLVSGIIATILLSIHFILKKKNIRSRPYITIISAAIMLYFGIQTLFVLDTIVMFLQQESPWHYLDQIVILLAYPIIGFSLIGLGIVFLYKSQLIRRLIRK